MLVGKLATGSLAVTLAVALLVPPLTPATRAARDDVRLIVELRDWQDSDELRIAAREVRQLSRFAPRQYRTPDGERTASDLRRWRSITTTVAEASSLEEQLQNNPAVQSVRRVFQYQAAVVPNDTEYGEQYHLRSSLAPLADINAEAAWEVTTGSSSTLIAVVDSGVDLDHEDLRSKIWTNSDEVAGNGLDDDGNGYVDDVHGWDFVAQRAAGTADKHATHVAGIAAAAGNNGLGVAGIDWGARIMSVRVLGGGGFGWEDNIIEGINYAVANGADIINLSLVGPSSEAMLAAIENAYAAGVTVVAAAGNHGINTTHWPVYPVCADVGGVDMVLGVAATDDEAEPANFSNYGDCINVAAPGDDILSTRPNDKYGELPGTSMSAPVAAGVAGLYLAKNPGASPAQIISALSSGKPFVYERDPEDAIEWTEQYGGRLDAAAVLGVTVDETVEPSPSPSPTPSPSPIADEDNPETSPEPSPIPTKKPSNEGSSGGGGGGGGDSGGGGSGGDEPEPAPTPKPQPAIHPKANLKLLSRVKDTFRFVFGRTPTTVERIYWGGRIKRAEKRTYPSLLGALLWQKAQGRTYDPRHVSVRTTTSPPKGRVAGATSTSLVQSINRIHRHAYGRNPSVSEHGYWLGRVQRGEKTTETALLGAMLYHRLAGIPH